jgi:hypothetical protein
LRISLDSKAKVKVGNLSRGGKDRRGEPLKALAHEHQPTFRTSKCSIKNTEF